MNRHLYILSLRHTTAAAPTVTPGVLSRIIDEISPPDDGATNPTSQVILPGMRAPVS